MASASLATSRDVWDRRPDETPEAWRAFVTFRDLPANERTFGHLATLLSKCESSLSRWSRKYAWRSRILEYEARLTELEQVRGRVNKLAAAARQAQVGKRMVEVASQRLAKVIPLELDPMEAARLAQMGSEVERQALGIDADDRPRMGGSVALQTATGDRLSVSWGENRPAWLPNEQLTQQKMSSSTPRVRGTRGKLPPRPALKPAPGTDKAIDK